MGCNCRGSKYIPTINRTATTTLNNICTKIAKEQLSLAITLTNSGEILIENNKLPAHSLLSANGCRGRDKDRILDLELKIVSIFKDPDKKQEFINKLGKTPTLGSIQAVVNSLDFG